MDGWMGDWITNGWGDRAESALEWRDSNYIDIDIDSENVTLEGMMTWSSKWNFNYFYLIL